MRAGAKLASQTAHTGHIIVACKIAAIDIGIDKLHSWGGGGGGALVREELEKGCSRQQDMKGNALLRPGE